MKIRTNQNLKEPKHHSTPDKINSVFSPKRKKITIWSSVVALVLLTLFLSGPGFRLMAKVAIVRAAKAEGLHGDLTFSGNLWSGFGIKDLALEGENSRIRKISLGEARVDYSLIKLITNFSDFTWLKNFAINDVSLHMVIPNTGNDSNSPTPVKEPKDKTSKKPGRVWNLLSANINLDRISANVDVGGKVYLIEEFALNLPNEKQGRLKIGTLKIPGIEERNNVETTLTKDNGALRIGPISLSRKLQLAGITIGESDPGILNIDASITAGKSALHAHYSNAGAASLSLIEGPPVDLTEISGDIPIRGILSSLHVDFTGNFSRPESWDLVGTADLSDAAWKRFTVDKARIRVIGGFATLTLVRADSSATIKANLPQSSSERSVTIDAQIAISSIDSVLKDLDSDLPVTGSLEGKITNLKLANPSTLQSGKLYLKTSNTTWGGQPVDGAEIDAEVKQTNHIDFQAHGGLSEHNTVKVTGTIDSETFAYKAAGNAKIKSDHPLATLLAVFHADEKFTGSANLDWKGTGNLHKKSHQGNITLDLPKVSLLSGKPFKGSLAAGYSDKNVTIPKLFLTNDQVSINGTASVVGNHLKIPNLTVKDKDGVRMRCSVEMPVGGGIADNDVVNVAIETDQLEVSSLAGFAFDKIPISGTLSGALTSKGEFSLLETAARFIFSPTLEAAGENSKLALNFSHRGKITSPSTWDMNLDAVMSGLKWKDTDLENFWLNIDMANRNGQKQAVATLAINQSTAKVEAIASMGLSNAHDFKALSNEPVAIEGSIVIDQIEKLIQDFAEHPPSIPLSGAVSATLSKLEFSKGHLQKGNISIHSNTLAVENTAIGLLNVKAGVTSPDHIEATLSLPLDEKSKIQGNGVYDMKDGGYAGNLAISADLNNNGTLRDIFAKRNFAKLLPAVTSLIWEGRGSVLEKIHLGKFSATGKSLRLADGALPIDFSLQGNYTEKSATIPVIKIESQPLNLNGSLEWKNNELRIPSLSGFRGDREVLNLNARIPFEPGQTKPQLWFQQAGELALNLETKELPLGEVLPLFRPEPPINGTATCNLSVTGTPIAPGIKGHLEVSDIIVANKDENLPVGILSLDLSAIGTEAVVKGQFLHPDVKPFTLNATLPFHPGEWASGARNFSNEPVKATAKMEQSSLAFLESQIPGIERISGTVSLDVDVSGSINQPKILGNGKVDVKQLRLENRNAPTFYDIDSAIRFSENTLIIDRLHAIVAGGIVDLSGNAILDGENPQLNFTLKGKDVLVARTPEVNVRTDADLTLTGPWQEARLSGSLGITNSRFFKNFDLLPIGLPTRNKSVLPTVERVPKGGGRATVDLDIGVPVEPFTNWPVAVHIYTKDPFLIRGNLAHSEVIADLVILGTLGKPVPKGVVKLNEGELTLPFSKVNVEVGKVVFSEQTGFNGALEFKAQAKAGDYKVNIYAFNRILEPKHVLTSVPPMPPEDLITLLATGTTRDKIAGSDAGSVAASKAAMLFLKNLKRSSSQVDRPPSILDKLQDRTELELGKVNPQTGAQTFGGKIQLWKQLFFAGDVDARSNYRALVKYVFEYR